MENVIIKFVADTSGLEPAIKQLELLGKISKDDAAAFNLVNQEQKEFIQNINKSTTEFGKLNTEVEGLMAEIQAGVMEGFADHLAEVTAESKKAGTGFKSMKQELRELKAQISSGSLGEKEMREATKRAAELQDAIGDVNDKVKALASDTKRIDAVVTAFRGVAAAASVAAGAAALFGNENEKLTKTLAQAQGAMALLQGVQELANIATTEGALRTMVLDGAQKVAAVSSRALGVTIAASTAMATAGLSVLVAGLAYLIITMDDARESATNMNKALADDAGVRKAANDKLLSMLKDGLDKELLMNKQAHDRELGELDKKFRAKTLSQKAYQDAVKIEDDYFLNKQQQTRDKYAQEEANKAKAQHDRIAKIRKDANNQALQDQLRQIRDEIANNEILMRETNDVNAKIQYHAEITRLRKAQIQLNTTLTKNEIILEQELIDDAHMDYIHKITKKGEDEIAIESTTSDKIVDVWALRIQRILKLQKQAADYNAKNKKKAFEDEKEAARFAIDQARVVSDTIFTINAQNRQAETNNILDSLNERRDAELSNQELTDAQRLQIEARYQQQEAQIKQRAWEAQKQADLAQAIINTALAVSRAWTIGPPQNIPAAIAAGIAGAAQIAIIANTQAPKFEKGGIVDGQLHSNGGTIIEAERGEYVVNRHATAEFLPVLKAINEGEPTFANNILASLATQNFALATQFQTKQTATDSSLDYDKLGRVLERNKSTVNINIDDSGFNKYIEKSNSKVNFRNSKLRIKA